MTATSGLTKGEMDKMIEAGKRYALERSANEDLEKKKQGVESLLVQMDRLFVAQAATLDPAAMVAARAVAARAVDAIDRQDLAALTELGEALASNLAKLKAPPPR